MGPNPSGFQQAMGALSLLPLPAGEFEEETPNLISRLLGRLKGKLPKKEPPILLKPNQQIYRDFEDYLLHMKKSGPRNLAHRSPPFRETGPLKDALYALNNRYPKLTEKLVKHWGAISDTAPGHLAATEENALGDPGSSRILWNIADPVHKRLEEGRDVLPALEHELTHAAQNWIRHRGLTNTFKIPKLSTLADEEIPYKRSMQLASDLDSLLTYEMSPELRSTIEGIKRFMGKSGSGKVK